LLVDDSTAERAPLLEVNDLVTSFDVGPHARVRAVDGVSLRVPARSTVGIVGESGCGKSVTALSILRLIPSPPGRIESGRIRLGSHDLLGLSERELRAVRGKRIAMIFQEPMTSLNPVYTVGAQLIETLRLRRPVLEPDDASDALPARLTRRQAKERAVELLRAVGIASADQRVDDYPHQLSGGMRQRVMIAMALACSPSLLIADEPTTALDVTVQAQILELLQDLQEKRGMSILLITHDLGVVAQFVQWMYVMYAGKVVESGPTREVFTSPAHPYTEALLASRRALEMHDARDVSGSASDFGGDSRRARHALPVIAGVVPSLLQLPAGCRFQDRCAWVTSECRVREPMLGPVREGVSHEVACFVHASGGRR
jgi:peptide/nickel transport system ATP-binding protein